jgi:hypothetical protein
VRAPAKRSPAKSRRLARIEVWRGYLSGEFLLLGLSGNGPETVLARSRAFRWLGAANGIPPAHGDALATFRAFVAEVERKGWRQIEGDPETWYGRRFAAPR